MDYYHDYLGSNESLKGNEDYPSTFYHNRDPSYYKQRRSRRESQVINSTRYYGLPTSEAAGSGYYDHRSSYVLDNAYYQNQQTYSGNSKPKKYRNEPITPEDGDYLPTGQNGDYGFYSYDNDSQTISDDTWTTHDIEEDEDPFVDDMTRKNTELNSEVLAYKPDEQPSLVHQFKDVTPILTPQEEILPEPIKKKWYKGIMNKGFMLRLKKPKKAAIHQSSVTLSSTPAVHVLSVSNNDTLGDVLDSNQQKEIIHQLNQHRRKSSPSSPMVLPLEKQKITSLDRIWVFRLWAENMTTSNEPVAWIGFDFENQLKIEKHIQELETRPEDGRLAIYDSHIRHKQMPVIITPNDKKGYYFMDMTQNQLVTLEVTFIQNNHQKVTFVYRM